MKIPLLFAVSFAFANSDNSDDDPIAASQTAVEFTFIEAHNNSVGVDRWVVTSRCFVTLPEVHECLGNVNSSFPWRASSRKATREKTSERGREQITAENTTRNDIVYPNGDGQPENFKSRKGSGPARCNPSRKSGLQRLDYAC